ncbi:hypothetical protein COHA_009494 [Chlorella ohadii]|uniref:Uncharacterized protein n=1 Tax=Chlorella ohadii TaxID=2649997 RepID=A0AAD5DLL5_9CHLO|nr:hypothetical protein COHA_009494 [Chlorella ohadii]
MGPAGARPAGGSRAEQLDPDVAVWRAAYARQKLLVLLTLSVDVVYLIVLLVLRLAWGGSNGEGSAPDLSTAAKFFVGSHPDTTSISFIAGTIFTDLIALYGVIQDYPSVVTLFIVWSVVLGAFAILEMPLLFMLLRLLMLVLAFQLRFSMARLHSMLPPASLAHLLSATEAGPSARTSSRADHSEGSGEEDAAVRAALGRPPSTPAGRESGGGRARPQEAVDRAAAVVQRSAGGSGSGAAPTWDDLMALLAVHSLEQAARRQSARTQAVVPLVSLEAPPPTAAAAPAADEAGGSGRPAAHPS